MEARIKSPSYKKQLLIYRRERELLHSAIMIRTQKSVPAETIELFPEWSTMEGAEGTEALIRSTYEDKYLLILEYKGPKGFFMYPHIHLPDGYKLEAIAVSEGKVRYQVYEKGGLKMVDVPAGRMGVINALVSHGFLILEESRGFVIFVKDRSPISRIKNWIKNLFYRGVSPRVKLQTQWPKRRKQKSEPPSSSFEKMDRQESEKSTQ